MTMATRSQIRVFHSNSIGKSPSSTVVPIAPIANTRITYCIRRIVPSHSQNDSLDTNANEVTVNIYKGGKVDETLELVSPSLAFIHIESSSSTFLEALPASKEVTLCRVGARNPHPSRISSVIPTSKDSPKERIFVLLDSDALIVIDGVLKVMYETVETSIAVPSTETAMELELAGIGNGNTEEVAIVNKNFPDGSGDELEATSPNSEIASDRVNRVLDTPHNRNKFKDINMIDTSSSVMSQLLDKVEERESTSPKFITSMSTSGLIYGGHLGGTEESNALTYDDGLSTGDDDENIGHRFSTVPNSPPSPTLKLADAFVSGEEPSKAEDISKFSNFAELISTTQTGGPSSTRTRISSASVEAVETEKGDDEDQLPDSLPPEFTVERKKPFSPPAQRTYGKKNARKVPEKMTETTQESDIWNPPEETQQMLNKRKRIGRKTVIEESTQPGNKKDEDREQGLATNHKEETGGELEPLDAVITKKSAKDGRKKEGKEEVPNLAENADTDTLVKAIPHRRPRLKRGDKRKEEIPSSTKTPAKTPAAKPKRKRTDTEKDDKEEIIKESSPTASSIESTVKVAIHRKTQEKEDFQPKSKKARLVDTTVESVDAFLSSAKKTPKSTLTIKGKRRSTSGPLAATVPTGESSMRASLPSNKAPDNIRTLDRYEGHQLHIVLSNTPLMTQKNISSTLRNLSIKKSEKVTDKGVNYLVIGSTNGLVRSSKLALSIALGIPIIEDSWILESSQMGYILDPEKYSVKSEEKEKEWGFVLEEAIERGKQGVLKKMLEGYTVHITPALLTQLKNSNQETGLIDVLKSIGVMQIIKKSPRGPPTGHDEEKGKGKVKGEKEDGDAMNSDSVNNDINKHRVLVFGGEKVDKDVTNLNDLGYTVWKTEMLTMSILRGELLTTEDFKIAPTSSPSHVGKEEESGKGEGKRQKRRERGM